MIELKWMNLADVEVKLWVKLFFFFKESTFLLTAITNPLGDSKCIYIDPHITKNQNVWEWKQKESRSLESLDLNIKREPELFNHSGASPVVQTVKNLPAMQETRVWSPGEGTGYLFQYSGEFHGQRNLMGYTRRGHKESDTTKWLTHSSTILGIAGK